MKGRASEIRGAAFHLVWRRDVIHRVFETSVPLPCAETRFIAYLPLDQLNAAFEERAQLFAFQQALAQEGKIAELFGLGFFLFF